MVVEEVRKMLLFKGILLTIVNKIATEKPLDSCLRRNDGGKKWHDGEENGGENEVRE
jgi:hypothetical protein